MCRRIHAVGGLPCPFFTPMSECPYQPLLVFLICSCPMLSRPTFAGDLRCSARVPHPWPTPPPAGGSPPFGAGLRSTLEPQPPVAFVPARTLTMVWSISLVACHARLGARNGVV